MEELEDSQAASAGAAIAEPESASAESDGDRGLLDSTSEHHEAWSFPRKADPDDSPAGAQADPKGTAATASEAKPDGTAPAGTQSPEGTQATKPADDGNEEPDDDVLERVLRSSKGQARVDQLVNGKLGNRMQQLEPEVRQRLQAEDAAWKAKHEFYEKLVSDDDFYSRVIADPVNKGEIEVKQWIVDHERKLAERNSATNGGVADATIQQKLAEYDAEFNKVAIAQFQEGASKLIPFWAELPEETRAAVGSLRYDPDGSWFSNGLKAVFDGVNKHLTTLTADHKKALDEAREAGRNQAFAEREERGPVVVDNGKPGSPYKNAKEVESAYINGRINRDQYRSELARFGVDP